MKISLIRAGIAAALYATFLVLFQYGFNLQDTNIRIASFLAPILGIMWGSAGAVGIGIGNFIADMFSPNFHFGYKLFNYILGSMGNSLVAFLSFMMWHSVFLRENEDPFAISLKNILRYIFIQLIVTAITSLYFTMVGLLSAWYDSAWQYFSIIMLNNLDINILIGLPILLMLMSSHYRFHQQHLKKPIFHNPRRFDALLLILCIVSAGIISMPIAEFDEIVIFRRIIAVLFFAYLLRPLPKIHRKRILIPQPIYYRIAKGFCVFMAWLTIILSLHTFLSMSGDYSSNEIWIVFYEKTFLVLHFTLAIQLILIWYIEKKVVMPLTKITETAAKFTESDPETEKISFEIIKSGDELELLSKTLHKMLESIYKYIDNLKQTLSERERTRTQLEIGMHIQTSILPSPSDINKKFPQIEVEALMNPALMVCGDFYDLKIIDDDHIVLVVSDISDKGIPAALFMMVTYTLIHHKISKDKNIDLTKIFYETNNQLCENNDTEMFSTAVAALYEISSGKLIYVNAGHTSPMIMHGDGTFEFLKKRSGPMLGSVEDIKFRQLETNLSAGDILILYSDGVTEALNEQEDFFQEQGLAESVKRALLANKKDNVTGELRNDIAQFAGNHIQSDDITIVALKIF